MALPRTPKRRWIEEGLRMLAEGGPHAVRIEALAKRLGVTKGGFYGYFADRDELLTALLDRWERAVTVELIDQVEAVVADGRAKVTALFDLVTSLDSPGDIATDLSIRDWARREEQVADRLRRVDSIRMDYLRQLYGSFCADTDEAAARATISFALWIARDLVAYDPPHGRTHGDVAAVVGRHLLA